MNITTDRFANGECVTVQIGCSTTGYATCDALVMAGKFRLVESTRNGPIKTLRSAVAALNRGEQSYITAGGDEKPIRVQAHPPAGY